MYGIYTIAINHQTVKYSNQKGSYAMFPTQLHRRALHQIPELDKELPNTIQYILQQLAPLRCDVIEPCRSTICAYFDFHKEDTMAFRSDMDALSIVEQNKCAYHSTIEGHMHACGHDGHMAMLISFAQYVNTLQDCEHNVLLIFQPAEETTGGAKDIVESGILSSYHVTKLFGFHVWPKLPKGQIASKAGPLMARSSELSIEIQGKSSHAARAEEGKDALYAAVEFLHEAYQFEQALPDHILRLLKFGVIESGTMRNVISSHTKILGTLRSFDEAVFLSIKNALFDIAKTIEQETGCTFSFHITEGYPPLINDESLFHSCKQILPELIELPKPSMLAEDFSFYGSSVPSLFLYLGIGDTPPLHADTFDFEDDVLEVGVHAYQALLHMK